MHSTSIFLSLFTWISHQALLSLSLHVLCHLSGTLFPLFFCRLLLVLHDSAQRSIVRGTDCSLETRFLREPGHNVFWPAGWSKYAPVFPTPFLTYVPGRQRVSTLWLSLKLLTYCPHLYPSLPDEPAWGVLPQLAVVWVLCHRPGR